MSGAGEDIGVQPLSGLRVIDFSQVVLGPCATQVLADYGADVIKIERPGTGDILRSAISDNVDPDNPVFRSVNRNKRSIALDLRKPDGKAVVYDLKSTRASSAPRGPASAWTDRSPTRGARIFWRRPCRAS